MYYVYCTPASICDEKWRISGVKSTRKVWKFILKSTHAFSSTPTANGKNWWSIDPVPPVPIPRGCNLLRLYNVSLRLQFPVLRQRGDTLVCTSISSYNHFWLISQLLLLAKRKYFHSVGLSICYTVTVQINKKNWINVREFLEAVAVLRQLRTMD